MSIGSVFWILGVLVALFSLIGLMGLAVDLKNIMIVLLFFGLGGAFGGVGIPAFTRS